MNLSRPASLVWRCARRTIHLAPNFSATNIVIATVHHFEESIAGRVYVIEVASVAENRWRAQIMRLPGIPTAMMPFYGQTPDEAAHQLTEWLKRAYLPTSAPPRTA